ncbi:unnamed protein product [Thelazia callipaeda]|uniref:N-acetyltransferase domain-containing protein n=1 Tax=Thelazia callipaeda TaxID=103827 RepID=A0A0N5D6J5_THECL|nr:unnamed protein product [Thelazia callipaeda]
MSVLRQRLLTDFCLPMKNQDSGSGAGIICESDSALKTHCELDSAVNISCEADAYKHVLLPVSEPSSSSMSKDNTCSKVVRSVIFCGNEGVKKRRKTLRDDSRQMILDAGQKQFGCQHCKECDMIYDYDSLCDLKRHRKFHGRFQSTEWFRVQITQLNVWKRFDFHIVEQYQGMHSYTFCVLQTSKSTLKTRITKVILECINQELGYAPDLAQIWTSDGRRQVWVYITALDTCYFIGAVAVVEQVSEKQIYWAEAENGIYKSDDLHMGVNRIWVHQILRGKGIAAVLLDHARTNFIRSDVIPRNRIVFSSPTENGLRFAKSYVPKEKLLFYKILSA